MGDAGKIPGHAHNEPTVFLAPVQASLLNTVISQRNMRFNEQPHACAMQICALYPSFLCI